LEGPNEDHCKPTPVFDLALRIRAINKPPTAPPAKAMSNNKFGFLSACVISMMSFRQKPQAIARYLFTGQENASDFATLAI